MQENGWPGFNSRFVLMKALGWSLTSLGLASLRCQMRTLSVPCLFVFFLTLWMGRHFAMNMMVGSGQLRWWWHNDKEDKTRFPQTCSTANPISESPFYDKGDKAREYRASFDQCQGHSNYWSDNSMKLQGWQQHLKWKKIHRLPLCPKIQYGETGNIRGRKTLSHTYIPLFKGLWCRLECNT